MNDKNQQLVPDLNELPSNADSPITALARIAASGAGKEVVEQMKGLIEWDDARRARAEFNAAFSNAKQKFKKAAKSGYNTHLKSKYSTLEDYDDATKEALSEFGLSWRHVPATLDGDVTSITCVLAHKTGHSESAEMRAPSYSMTNNAVNKLQSVGIVATYLKRMTLAAQLGLVSSDQEFDNDGNGGEAEPQAAPVVVDKATQNTVHDKTLTYLESSDGEKMKSLWGTFGADEQVVLWRMFSSQQRTAIKKLIRGEQHGN